MEATTRAAQEALNRFVFVSPKLTPDGVFGPKTAAAIQQFQRATGMVVTGSISAILLQALGVNAAPPAAAAAGGWSAAAAIFGVHPQAIATFRDAAGRAWSAPSNATVRMQDTATGRVSDMTMAQALSQFGRGLTLGIFSGGTEITGAALEAGKYAAKETAKSFFQEYSAALLLGGGLLVLVLVLRND
jgi:peptidoglycan hydrolase-like protein with peptidoglycan-binding domain